MGMSAGGEDGQADTGRAEAFSDGVLAIIITLLVLDLRPPGGEPGGLLRGLLRQWPTYLAYVTSYVYVGVVWLNHKAMFRRIRSIDRGLHWANFGILFTTALLPFATAVLARAVEHGNRADERTAVGLYALVGALLCASWWTFFHYLSRHPHLTEEDVEETFFPTERTRASVGVVLYAAAGVLGCFVAVPIAMVIFLALPVFYGVTSNGLYALPSAVSRM
jgi:uncharacterized membrane protein